MRWKLYIDREIVYKDLWYSYLYHRVDARAGDKTPNMKRKITNPAYSRDIPKIWNYLVVVFMIPLWIRLDMDKLSSASRLLPLILNQIHWTTITNFGVNKEYPKPHRGGKPQLRRSHHHHDTTIPVPPPHVGVPRGPVPSCYVPNAQAWRVC